MSFFLNVKRHCKSKEFRGQRDFQGDHVEQHLDR